MKICPKCNHENKDASKFCEECGTKLVDASKFCPECGTKLNGTPKFCPECGTKIGNISEVTPAMDENGDRNYMSMWNAIEFGDIEKAKELIDSGEKDDYSIYICDVHNVKMLEFLWDYGNFNLYDENDDLLSRVIYKYSSDLNDYRKNQEYDF